MDQTLDFGNLALDSSATYNDGFFTSLQSNGTQSQGMGQGGKGGQGQKGGKGGKKGGPPKNAKGDAKMIVSMFMAIWTFTFMKMTQVGMMNINQSVLSNSAKTADGVSTARMTGSVYKISALTGLLLTPIGVLGTIATFLGPIYGASMFPLVDSLVQTSAPAGFVLFAMNLYKTLNRSDCSVTTDFQCWYDSSATTSQSWTNGSYTQQSRESYVLSIQMIALSLGTTELRRWVRQTIGIRNQRKQNQKGKGGKGDQKGAKGGKGGKGEKGPQDDKYDGYTDSDQDSDYDLDFEDEDYYVGDDSDYYCGSDDSDCYVDDDTFGLEYEEDNAYDYDADYHNSTDLSNSTDLNNSNNSNASNFSSPDFTMEASL